MSHSDPSYAAFKIDFGDAAQQRLAFEWVQRLRAEFHQTALDCFRLLGVRETFRRVLVATEPHGHEFQERFVAALLYVLNSLATAPAVESTATGEPDGAEYAASCKHCRPARRAPIV